MIDRVVIVGAGQGGFQAAASLRQEGFSGLISLIGAEPELPYQRPPLSKAYLTTGDRARLTLRPQEYFETFEIELALGTQIEEIDRKAQEVRGDGRAWAYDHLILATGTRNLRPPIEGLDRALDLRTVADAERLRGELSRPRRCAVIGGGFIGLEFAAVARKLGHEVTVAEAASRLMQRAVSSKMSARFLELHRAMGTKIELGSPVASIGAQSIALESGREVPADMVLLATGVRPNTELAARCGLAVDNGVCVNERLVTEDDAISALGDCAVFPHRGTGRPVRLESVQAATDHAKAIAKRLAHAVDEPYAAVPWFWSDQGDERLQIAGLGWPADVSVENQDGVVLRFSEEALSAVETINNAKVHMTARRIMATSAVPSRSDLAKANYDLTLFR